MNRTIILIVVLLGTAVQAATVTLEERVAATVAPDMMHVQLTFEEENSLEAPLRDHFNTIVATVKRHHESGALTCRGGGYRIAPRYRWTDNRRNFLGYQGNVGFQCSFKTVEAFDALSTELEGQTRTMQGVKRHQGEIRWGASDTLRGSAREALERQLIGQVKAHALRLSDAMGTRCAVGAINIGHNGTPVMPMARTVMTAEAAAPTETPIQGEEKLSLSASVTFTCE
jgi:predicted secreted protein